MISWRETVKKREEEKEEEERWIVVSTLGCHAMLSTRWPWWTYLCHVRQTAAAATRVSKLIQGYP